MNKRQRKKIANATTKRTYLDSKSPIKYRIEKKGNV